MGLFWLIGGLIGVLGAFAAVPIVIHLINMMRHRRVKWAAMDFLLQSYKKHRNWIWLKQLLLLLMRIATMVLVALMLCLFVHYLINNVRSRMGVSDAALSGLFGGKTIHHYVVVDDSYSMADRVGSMTAFERARKSISTIAARAGQRDNQRFTLIRYSQAIGDASDDIEGQIEEIADLNAIEVDKDFDQLLEEHRSRIDASEYSVGPVPALGIVRQLVAQREGEKAIVYLVSDYRAKEWDSPAEIQKSLRAIRQQDAEIQLVNCVKNARPNLGITDLAPENETRAAGVPLFVNVTVKNFGTQAAKKVQVKISSTSFEQAAAASADPNEVEGKVDVLPTVYFEEIGPGQEATRRVQVFFDQPGKHVVEATLQDDPVETDNHRWCVVDFLDGVPVLVIDNSLTKQDAYFLATAFEPGKTRTGMNTEVQTSAYLRDASPELLAGYHTIYLADIDISDLTASSISNLEEFVRNGGGLGIFVGPNVGLKSYNDLLYRKGEGALPMPFDRVVELGEMIGKKVPDVVVDDHPIFNAVMAQRNPLINTVSVVQYLKPPIDWNPHEHPDVKVIGRVRDGDPLVVERKFGDGRVVVFLTTLGKEWTNWSRNPTFVVVSLKLQAYLSAHRRLDVPRNVGAPIEIQLPTEKYRKEVTFVVPSKQNNVRATIDRNAVKVNDDSPLMTVAVGGAGGGEIGRDETGRSGVYEAWAFGSDGKTDVRRFAVNVESAEGDLALADSKSLLTNLEQVKPKYLHWDELDAIPVQQAGFNWGRWILLILIVLLLLEQAMAYAVSYHPIRGASR